MSVDIFKSTFRLVLFATGLIVIALQGGCEAVVEPDPFPTSYDAALFDGDRLATDWYDVLNSCVQRTPGFTDPVAARLYGYAGITLYESIVYGLPDNRSLVGQISVLKDLPRPDTSGNRYQWSLVANAAMGEFLRNIFDKAPADVKNSIDSLDKKNVDERRVLVYEDPMVDRSIDYGKAFGKAMFEISKSDGGHEAQMNNFPSSYTPPQGQEVWRPTPPLLQTTPLLPEWGKNVPLLLNDADITGRLNPGAPLTFSADKSSAFYAAANEVYGNVKSITIEQKSIVRYWEDPAGTTSTSAGHIMNIITQLLKTKAYSLSVAAEAYARVGIAVNDGCIACWKYKYQYNLMRPLTYIQQSIDNSWNTNGVTDPIPSPPMPEYIAGHVMQGAAASEIMKVMFGNTGGFYDRTHISRGLADRWYTGMDHLMQEIATSQLYSGTQFRFSVDAGKTMGTNIGTIVMQNLSFKKVQAQ